MRGGRNVATREQGTSQKKTPISAQYPVKMFVSFLHIRDVVVILIFFLFILLFHNSFVLPRWERAHTSARHKVSSVSAWNRSCMFWLLSRPFERAYTNVVIPTLDGGNLQRRQNSNLIGKGPGKWEAEYERGGRTRVRPNEKNRREKKGKKNNVFFFFFPLLSARIDMQSSFPEVLSTLYLCTHIFIFYFP